MNTIRALTIPLYVTLFSCSPTSDEAALGGNVQASTVPATLPEKAASDGGDGPFGIEAGTSLSSLDVQSTDVETGLSVLSSPPKPSSQFPHVAVIAFPGTGVCSIRALSSIFDSDPYITSATGFVDETASALNSRYGEGNKQAGCSGRSCDSEYKLMRVEDGSLWYSYEWRKGTRANLSNRVESIDLYVTHAQFNDSQVRLDYAFDNKQACERASKIAKSGNL